VICSIEIHQQRSTALTHCAARWRQICELFRNRQFERSSLTHRTTHRHQIFRFTRYIYALVDCRALARSLYNWGRYCVLNFEKKYQISKFWSPLTQVRERKIKKWAVQNFLFYRLTRYDSQNLPRFSIVLSELI